MNKGLLDRFISKYNLSGAAEQVILESAKKTLKTKFITDDKNAVGFIATKVEFEEGEYPVYETAQLRSLLSVLDDEVAVTVGKKQDGTPLNLTFSDKNTKATFVLAEKQNIPASPNMKNLPDFEISIALDQKFISSFAKAKSALPEVETFTVVVGKNDTNIVLGHSDLNINKISLAVESDVTESIEPISFSARYFKDILLSNKEMKKGTLRVSSKGLAHITFEIDDFTVDYYLVKIAQ
jgi:hypothetical protein